MSRRYISTADLELGKSLVEKFNNGAKFETLCSAHNITKTRGRMLMLEATKQMAKSMTPDTSKVSAATLDAVHQGITRGLAELFDSDTLREIVKDEVAKFPPQTGEIKVVLPDTKPVVVKQSHAMLKESLRRISAGFNNILLVGPAGSGKTTLAAQLSKCLKRDFGFLSLSGGTTEGQLLGRITPAGKFLPSKFVDVYENGGVFLLDEVDAADPNVLLVLNSALANGALSVPARIDNPVAERHENFVLVCVANTWGTGADWQYVGRNQLDAAFLSRFAGAVLEVTYDAQLERSLTAESWYNEFIRVRSAVAVSKLRRILGTREMLAGQRLLKAGYTSRETWAALTAGWSNDERFKAGVAV